MGYRYELKDADWDRIKNRLPGSHGLVGFPAKDNRSFLNAVLWIARTGAPWRDLPERYGNWNTIYRRFRRWAKGGVFHRIFKFLSVDADLEEMLIDSSSVRAHSHAAGATKTDDSPEEGLGRSRAGFTTKIHAVVDALGNPVDFQITGGQVNDITQAQLLLEGKNGQMYWQTKRMIVMHSWILLKKKRHPGNSQSLFSNSTPSV